MKYALLIFGWYPDTKKGTWVWTTPQERDLSRKFSTREEALIHRPKGYIHFDDGYCRI